MLNHNSAPGDPVDFASFGRAVMAITSRRDSTIGSWLEVLASTAMRWAGETTGRRFHLGERPEQVFVGAWAAVFTAGGVESSVAADLKGVRARTGRVRCIAQSLEGYANPATRSGVQAYVQDGCRIDDFGHEEDAPSVFPGHQCIGSKQLRQNYPQAGKKLWPLRRELGLGEFVRLSCLVAGPQEPWVIVVNLDAVPIGDNARREWPEEHVTAMLGVLTPFVQRGYDLAVGRMLSHRAALMGRLTQLQREMVPFLLTSMTEKEIAKQTKRGHHTVHDAVKGIYSALGVSSRVELLLRWHALDGQEAAQKTREEVTA